MTVEQAQMLLEHLHRAQQALGYWDDGSALSRLSTYVETIGAAVEALLLEEVR